MTPSTLTANLSLWAAAFAGAIALSALASVARHWPEGAGVDWRAVTLDVIATILTTAPLVAAGLGLPRLGHEPVAALVSHIGKANAQAALEVEAVKQETGIRALPLTTEQRRLIVSDLKAELMATPAESDPLITPHWLPPAPERRA